MGVADDSEHLLESFVPASGDGGDCFGIGLRDGGHGRVVGRGLQSALAQFGKDRANLTVC
jgi:hypothetical protein